jgi:hypothetical protein
MKKQRINWSAVKNYISGGTAVVLSVVCFLTILIQGYEKRLLMAGIFLFLMGVFSLYIAVKEQNIQKNEPVIMVKNGQLAIQLTNRLLFSFTLLFILLYGITKIFLLFIFGVILCGITVLLLIALFILQRMERKNN